MAGRNSLHSSKYAIAFDSSPGKGSLFHPCLSLQVGIYCSSELLSADKETLNAHSMSSGRIKFEIFIGESFSLFDKVYYQYNYGGEYFLQ